MRIALGFRCAPGLAMLAASLFCAVARANIGVNTVNPVVGLDVNSVGSASAIIVPRDSTANRPAVGVNGMIRYNTSATALEAYVNGGWVQLATQPLGSTTNVYPSGPPPNANIYSYTASVNYTPTYGAVANINNGVWPPNNTSTYQNPNCLTIRDQGVSPMQIVTLDLGSVKTINNFYTYQSTGYYFQLGITFSTDGVSYSSGPSAFSVGASDAYASSTLSPSVTARYVRLINSAASGADSRYEALCQFAVGP